jgi:hypothetical protein
MAAVRIVSRYLACGATAGREYDVRLLHTAGWALPKPFFIYTRTFIFQNKKKRYLACTFVAIITLSGFVTSHTTYA